MKKNSTKNLRINSEVQKELAILISSEVKDPRISPLTSVTDVEVATDLKTAKVYVSVLGDDKQKQDTLKGLKSAEPFLRSSLAHTVNLRHTPELFFKLDESMEYAAHISELLENIKKKDAGGLPADDESQPLEN
jgi:ribosome-binding factor A